MQIDVANDIEKSKKLAKHYYKISLDDLKDSDFLYKKGSYSASLFYLQQATEKLIKSCGHQFGIYPEKNVSHATWKIYCNMLKYFYSLDLQAQRKIILDSPILEYLFKKFKLRQRTFKNLNKFLLDDKNIYNIKKIDFPPDIVKKTLEHNYFLKVDTLNILEFNNEDIWYKKILKGLGIASMYVSAIWQLSYLFPLFSIDISIILFQHVEMTRYGIESDEKSPNEIYKQEHVLIKEYDKIYEIINNMQKMFKGSEYWPRWNYYKLFGH